MEKPEDKILNLGQKDSSHTLWAPGRNVPLEKGELPPDVEALLAPVEPLGENMQLTPEGLLLPAHAMHPNNLSPDTSLWKGDTGENRTFSPEAMNLIEKTNDVRQQWKDFLAQQSHQKPVAVTDAQVAYVHELTQTEEKAGYDSVQQERFRYDASLFLKEECEKRGYSITEDPLLREVFSHLTLGILGGSDFSQQMNREETDIYSPDALMPKKETRTYYDKTEGVTKTYDVLSSSAFEHIAKVFVEVGQSPYLDKGKQAVILSKVAEVLGNYKQEMRWTLHEASLEMPDLSKSLISAAENFPLSPNIRYYLYDSLFELRIPSELQENLMETMDKRHDLSHPLAFDMTLSLSTKTESAWIQKQELRRNQLLEILTHKSPQELFDLYDQDHNFISLIRGLVMSLDPKNMPGERAGMDIEFESKFIEESLPFAPYGWSQPYYDQRPVLEIAKSDNLLDFNENYLRDLSRLTHWFKSAETTKVVTIHSHVDRAQVPFEPNLQDLLGDSLQTLRENDLGTWEERRLGIPQYKNTIKPQRIADIMNLLIQDGKRKDVNAAGDKIHCNSSDISWDKLVWGHLCQQIVNPQERLTALLLLTDQLALRSFDPISFYKSYTPESMTHIASSLDKQITGQFQTDRIEELRKNPTITLDHILRRTDDISLLGLYDVLPLDTPEHKKKFLNVLTAAHYSLRERLFIRLTKGPVDADMFSDISSIVNRTMFSSPISKTKAINNLSRFTDNPDVLELLRSIAFDKTYSVFSLASHVEDSHIKNFLLKELDSGLYRSQTRLQDKYLLQCLGANIQDPEILQKVISSITPDNSDPRDAYAYRALAYSEAKPEVRAALIKGLNQSSQDLIDFSTPYVARDPLFQEQLIEIIRDNSRPSNVRTHALELLTASVDVKSIQDILIDMLHNPISETALEGTVISLLPLLPSNPTVQKALLADIHFPDKRFSIQQSKFNYTIIDNLLEFYSKPEIASFVERVYSTITPHERELLAKRFLFKEMLWSPNMTSLTIQDIHTSDQKICLSGLNIVDMTFRDCDKEDAERMKSAVLSQTKNLDPVIQERVYEIILKIPRFDQAIVNASISGLSRENPSSVKQLILNELDKKVLFQKDTNREILLATIPLLRDEDQEIKRLALRNINNIAIRNSHNELNNMTINALMSSLQDNDYVIRTYSVKYLSNFLTHKKVRHALVTHIVDKNYFVRSEAMSQLYKDGYGYLDKKYPDVYNAFLNNLIYNPDKNIRDHVRTFLLASLAMTNNESIILSDLLKQERYAPLKRFQKQVSDYIVNAQNIPSDQITSSVDQILH